MKQATQTRLIEKALSLMETGATDFGEAETRWPVEQYFDAERFEEERAMAARQPVPIAHSTQLVRPGDYVREQLLGRPIVAVRTESGGVRAFLNVCRHRGSELVLKSKGNVGKSFVCPYHAWTYDLDGKLTHVPDQRGSFPNLDCERSGLVPLAAEERHGLVWVVPSPDAAPPSEGMVESFLGQELDEEFAGFGFADYVFFKQETWRRGFNWKAGVESFLENYHFAVLHKNTTDPIFVHNVGICDRLDVHFRALAPKRTIKEMRDRDQSEWSIRDAATVVTVVFPYSLFFVEQSHFSLLQIVPETPETSIVKATHAVAHDSLRMRPFYEANVRLFNSAIIDEDLAICESMQRGFHSEANREVLFGRNEVGCDAYRRCIDEQLALARTGAAAGNGSAA